MVSLEIRGTGSNILLDPIEADRDADDLLRKCGGSSNGCGRYGLGEAPQSLTICLMSPRSSRIASIFSSSVPVRSAGSGKDQWRRLKIQPGFGHLAAGAVVDADKQNLLLFHFFPPVSTHSEGTLFTHPHRQTCTRCRTRSESARRRP